MPTSAAVEDHGLDLGVILGVVPRLGLTGRLRVGQDGWAGEIFFNRGQLVSAEFGAEQGWSALEAILLVLPTGECTFSQEPPPAEPNITPSVETLDQRLDDMARRRARLASRLPLLSTVPRICQPPSDWRAGGDVTLPRSTLSILTAIDGRRSVRELCLGHSLVRTLEDLAVLADLGLVDLGLPASPAPPPDGNPAPPLDGTPQLPESAPATPSRGVKSRFSGDRDQLARAARRYGSSLSRSLRDARQTIRSQAQRPERARLWLGIPVMATAVAIGLIMSLQVVRSTGGASPTPFLPEATARGAAGGSSIRQPNDSGARPRVLLDERFGSQPGNWPNNPNSTAWLVDGAYRLVARQAGQFVALGAPIASTSPDLVVTATMRKSGGPPGGGYGLIVRDQAPGPRDGVSQTGNFYVLLVNDRGEVAMSRREGDHWVELLPWTASDAVHQGDAANELIALAVGPQLGLAVNGTLVASREDRTLTSGGVGLYVGGDDTEVTVERFRVEELPANSVAGR